jgi:chemotaxis protein CheX
VVINLSEAIALQLASCLLDEEMEELDEDCTDAIGEMANMVAGNAKNNFPNPDTSISVPSVILGAHKISYPSGIPIISIPCSTDRGEFIVDIALRSNT